MSTTTDTLRAPVTATTTTRQFDPMQRKHATRAMMIVTELLMKDLMPTAMDSLRAQAIATTTTRASTRKRLRLAPILATTTVTAL
jgi:hypothetical protein